MKLLKKSFATLALLFVLVLPVFVFAKPPGDTPTKGIQNPLKCENCDDIGSAILGVTEEVARIGFYVVVLFIIYSGFLFIKAQGDTTKLTAAKNTFLYTVIGAAILLGATVLSNVIKGTVDGLQEGSSETQTL